MFKKALACAATVLALSSCQSTEPGTSTTKDDHQHGPAADQPSVHGMLVLGDGPVYLSHLPMFHGPHDYQVLLEVQLVKDGSDPTSLYAQDRRVTGEKVYTLVPEAFSLPELFGPTNGLPQRTSFKAKVYRGHFERGGVQFLSGLTVQVKRVVHAKKFDRNPTALPHSKYFVFGNAGELFGAHVVNKKPDFDHLIALRISSGILSEVQAEAVRAGVVVDLPSVANDASAAPAEGDSLEGTIDLGQGQQPLNLEVLTSYYLETGDLSF